MAGQSVGGPAGLAALCWAWVTAWGTAWEAPLARKAAPRASTAVRATPSRICQRWEVVVEWLMVSSRF